MLVAKLLLVGLLGQVAGEQADPGDLVSQLGAGRYAEREAASRPWSDLGRPALPALRPRATRAIRRSATGPRAWSRRSRAHS